MACSTRLEAQFGPSLHTQLTIPTGRPPTISSLATFSVTSSAFFNVIPFSMHVVVFDHSVIGRESNPSSSFFFGLSFRVRVGLLQRDASVEARVRGLHGGQPLPVLPLGACESPADREGHVLFHLQRLLLLLSRAKGRGCRVSSCSRGRSTTCRSSHGHCHPSAILFAQTIVRQGNGSEPRALQTSPTTSTIVVPLRSSHFSNCSRLSFHGM